MQVLGDRGRRVALRDELGRPFARARSARRRRRSAARARARAPARGSPPSASSSREPCTSSQVPDAVRRRARATPGCRRRADAARDGGTTGGSPSPGRSSPSQRSAAGLLSSTVLSSASRTRPVSSGSPRVSADRALRTIACRRPSASSGATAATTRPLLGREVRARRLAQERERPPRARVAVSAARSSSPKPCGRLTSWWRRLRSSRPSVASLRVAALRGPRASASNLLKSASPNSISVRRGVASARQAVLHHLAGRQQRGRVQREHADAVEGHLAAQDPRGVEGELAHPEAPVHEVDEIVAHAFGHHGAA